MNQSIAPTSNMSHLFISIYRVMSVKLRRKNGERVVYPSLCGKKKVLCFSRVHRPRSDSPSFNKKLVRQRSKSNTSDYYAMSYASALCIHFWVTRYYLGSFRIQSAAAFLTSDTFSHSNNNGETLFPRGIHYVLLLGSTYYYCMYIA